MSKFVEVPEFKKDFKKLLKRFKSLSEDLVVFMKALSTDPKNLNGAFKISHLGGEIYPVYKARKFRCRSLQRGNQSGIRIIYTYHPITQEIFLMEIYFKGNQENHSLDRIKKYSIKI